MKGRDNCIVAYTIYDGFMRTLSLIALFLPLMAMAIETIAGQPRQILPTSISKNFSTKLGKTSNGKKRRQALIFASKPPVFLDSLNFPFDAEMKLENTKNEKCYSIELTNVRDESEGFYTYAKDPFRFIGQDSKIVVDKAYLLTNDQNWWLMFVGAWGSSVSDAISSTVYRLNPYFEKEHGVKLFPDLACSAFAYQAPESNCSV